MNKSISFSIILIMLYILDLSDDSMQNRQYKKKDIISRITILRGNNTISLIHMV